MSYDKHMVEELLLYADNDEPIYRRKKAFLDNVRRKIERGTYDKAKAPALWVYWLTEAARKYSKEWPGTHFSVADRRKAAEIVAERELEMLMAGEYGPPPAFKATRTRKAHSPASRYRSKPYKMPHYQPIGGTRSDAAASYMHLAEQHRIYADGYLKAAIEREEKLGKKDGLSRAWRKTAAREQQIAQRAYNQALALEQGSPTRSSYGRSKSYCPVGTRAQTVLFDRTRFTRADAVAWAHRAGFHTRSVEVGPKVIHLRQAAPQSFKKSGFRHKKIAPGVAIVIGCPK